MNLIAEYDASNNVLRRYVHGPGIDEPLVWYEGAGTTSKTWLYADHQGSIVGQADATGTSTAIYSYDPFGEPNQTAGTRFRYTGQQYLAWAVLLQGTVLLTDAGEVLADGSDWVSG